MNEESRKAFEEWRKRTYNRAVYNELDAARDAWVISEARMQEKVKELVAAAKMCETEMHYAGFAKLEDDNVGKKPAYFALLQALASFNQSGSEW